MGDKKEKKNYPYFQLMDLRNVKSFLFHYITLFIDIFKEEIMFFFVVVVSYKFDKRKVLISFFDKSVLLFKALIRLNFSFNLNCNCEPNNSVVDLFHIYV